MEGAAAAHITTENTFFDSSLRPVFIRVSRAREGFSRTPSRGRSLGLETIWETSGSPSPVWSPAFKRMFAPPAGTLPIYAPRIITALKTDVAVDRSQRSVQQHVRTLAFYYYCRTKLNCMPPPRFGGIETHWDRFIPSEYLPHRELHCCGRRRLHWNNIELNGESRGINSEVHFAPETQ